MLRRQEKNILKKLLSFTRNPEDTFSYDELLGFLFGLAMTPEPLPHEEWIPCIFGGEDPAYPSAEEKAETIDCLLGIRQQYADAFAADRLDFPIDIGSLGENRLVTVYEWVSGFDEALTLREHLWDPEFFPRQPKAKKEELYFSQMIIQGLVDPEEVGDFFDNLPDEFIRESLPGLEGENMDRDMQTQIFLLAFLPLAIQTLQQHARAIETKKRGGKKPVQLSLVKPAARRTDSSCGGCGSAGQPGSCCGEGTKQAKAPAGGRHGKVIKVDFPQHGKKVRKDAPVYQLKVSLEGTRPPIWRRLLVPGDLTLAQLHKIIQLVMGWTDSHLHQFIIDGTLYSLPEQDELPPGLRPKNEATFTLQTLDRKIRNGFHYVYDFGDDWQHRITVEKVLEPGEDKRRPVLLAGRRACPPEDVGGIAGYVRLLESLDDPNSDYRREYREWLGEDFSPARFGREEISLINAVLEEIYP